MFDIGWSEMAVIGVVALVVLGPKDLPRVLRQVGQWTGKARALAREFQGHLDDIARQSELDELKKQAEKLTSFDVKNEIANTVDPSGDLRKTVEEAAAAAEAAVSQPSAAAQAAVADASPEPVASIEPPRAEVAAPESGTKP